MPTAPLQCQPHSNIQESCVLKRIVFMLYGQVVGQTRTHWVRRFGFGSIQFELHVCMHARVFIHFIYRFDHESTNGTSRKNCKQCVYVRLNVKFSAWNDWGCQNRVCTLLRVLCAARSMILNVSVKIGCSQLDFSLFVEEINGWNFHHFLFDFDVKAVGIDWIEWNELWCSKYFSSY